MVRSRSLDRERYRGVRSDLSDGCERPVEDHRIGEGAHRKTMFVVPDAEAAISGVEGELQIAFFEGFAVAVSEKRNDQLAICAEPLPIDVEGRRGGESSPHSRTDSHQAIVGAADSHVVGHDVEHEPEAVLTQSVG